jgi:hypothetical protein
MCGGYDSAGIGTHILSLSLSSLSFFFDVCGGC